MSDIAAEAQSRLQEEAVELIKKVRAHSMEDAIGVVLEYRECLMEDVRRVAAILVGQMPDTVPALKEQLAICRTELKAARDSWDVKNAELERVTKEGADHAGSLSDLIARLQLNLQEALKLLEQKTRTRARELIDEASIARLQAELKKTRESWSSILDEAEDWKEQLEDALRKLAQREEELRYATTFSGVVGAARGQRMPEGERRRAWRHYAGVAMSLAQGQFAFNTITQIADQALEAEEARFSGEKP